MKDLKIIGRRFAGTAFVFIALTACVVRPAAQRPLPPPVRVEVVPRAPSPRHHWNPGYYQWRRGHYVWVAGRYRR